MNDEQRMHAVEELSHRERQAKADYEQAREAARLAEEQQRAAKREWDRLIAELRGAVVGVVDDGVATQAEVLNWANRSWQWWYRARQEYPAPRRAGEESE